MAGALDGIRVIDFGQYIAGRWLECCWRTKGQT